VLQQLFSYYRALVMLRRLLPDNTHYE